MLAPPIDWFPGQANVGYCCPPLPWLFRKVLNRAMPVTRMGKCWEASTLLCASSSMRLSSTATFSSSAGATGGDAWADAARSEEHTSELQSQSNLVCRLLLEKK